MEGLKRLVRDAGRAGIPVIGYNFSIAGVWGWRKRRAGARRRHDRRLRPRRRASGTRPIPDGMVWNMRYRDGDAGRRAGHGRRGGAVGAPRVVPATSSCRWPRRPACGSRPIPTTRRSRRLRGTARLVNRPEKYDRLLAIAPSPPTRSNSASARSQEMPGGDIYADHAPLRAPEGASPTSTSATCAARCRATSRPSSTTATSTWREIVRILRDEGFDGVLVPDHVPELDCPAPWHAGHAYTVGYMKALIGSHADARAVVVGGARPSRQQEESRSASERPQHGPRRENRATQEETMKSLKLAGFFALSVLASAATTTVARAGEVVWWTPNWGEARAAELAEKFVAANPGITVKIEITVSDGLPQRVLTALQSGAAPDIIEVQHGWVNGYAQNDLVVAARRRDPGQRGLRAGGARLRDLGRQALGHPLPHRDARRHLQQGRTSRRPGSIPRSRRRPGTSWSTPPRRSRKDGTLRLRHHRRRRGRQHHLPLAALHLDERRRHHLRRHDQGDRQLSRRRSRRSTFYTDFYKNGLVAGLDAGERRHSPTAGCSSPARSRPTSPASSTSPRSARRTPTSTSA